MARERMVTRTIKSAEVIYKAYNDELDTLETLTLIVTGIADKESAEGTARRMANKAGKPVLKILEVKITEQLYGMDEVEFLKYAVPMKPGDTRVPKKEDQR